MSVTFGRFVDAISSKRWTITKQSQKLIIIDLQTLNLKNFTGLVVQLFWLLKVCEWVITGNLMRAINLLWRNETSILRRKTNDEFFGCKHGCHTFLLFQFVIFVLIFNLCFLENIFASTSKKIVYFFLFLDLV